MKSCFVSDSISPLTELGSKLGSANRMGTIAYVVKGWMHSQFTELYCANEKVRSWY